MGRKNKGEKIGIKNVNKQELHNNKPEAKSDDVIPPKEWQRWRNIADMWVSQVNKYGTNVMAVAKKDGRWRDFSWDEIDQEVKKIALGLIQLGMNHGDAVGIFSKTRLEWMCSSLGILLAGGVITCIYHTDSPPQCQHILTNSDATICFVEEQEQLDKILEIWDNCPKLRYVICFERYEPKEIKNVIKYSDLLKIGEKVLDKEDALKELQNRIKRLTLEDPFALIYTSGTTGLPKGAIITHGNTLFCCWAFTKVFPIGENDLAFCFLPLAHAGGLTLTQFSSISVGCPIAFAEDMMNTAMEDMYETEPTWMFCTPRLYEKVYNQIMGIIEEAPWLRKQFILSALRVGYKVSKLRQKRQKIPFYLRLLNYICHLLVFRRVKEMFGGRMRVPFTGGAPIAKKIIEFFDAVGMPLIEVYGQTETSSIIMCNRLNDYRIGSVGKPIPGIKVRLAEDNEIQVYAPQLVCKGYNKDPEATKNLFTEDGWLRTGDVGKIDEEGYYYIVDRKKHILITAAGKNVAPQYIENILKTHRFISQAIVYGDGQPYLVALLTLDEDEVIKYARDNRIIYTDFRDLTKNEKIIETVWKIIQERNKELARVEQIKKFYILEDELYQDDEEVTPTMKVKKATIEARYGHIIKQLYKLPKSEYTIREKN
ncbi:MAG TPA: long-chain fatty acid--CoA ligase [Thermococcus sp.]|nr:long-chain fatty acid--CoA ligase [Thermococcus sp.]